MSILTDLRARRAALVTERQAIADGGPENFDAATEKRFDAIVNEITIVDGRIAQFEVNEQREANAAPLRKLWKGAAGANQRTTAGGVPLKIQDRPVAEVYHRDGDHSFFGDLLRASMQQDRDAAERLVQNQQAQGRAATTVSGAGGQFAPPMWLVDEFVELARPGRVTADIVQKHELPTGVSSVNLPKVATGTAVGVTQTQASAITQTDITTTSVSSGITTISGGQTISLELLHQGGTAMDQVILQDLAMAYAAQIEQQVLSGTGADGQLRGLLTVTAGTTVTYTTTAPAVVSTVAAASFMRQILKAANGVATTRHMPPDAIVMHPRRWAWVLDGLDGANRPIIASGGTSENSIGVLESVAGSGRVGSLAGIPVYASSTIPTTLGAATNQDTVMVLRTKDVHLWESPLMLETFQATYAPSNALFVRALGFAAFIADRQAESLATIGGTGLVDAGI